MFFFNVLIVGNSANAFALISLRVAFDKVDFTKFPQQEGHTSREADYTKVLDAVVNVEDYFLDSGKREKLHNFLSSKMDTFILCLAAEQAGISLQSQRVKDNHGQWFISGWITREKTQS